MPNPENIRVLVIVFDALRPEFVTPELMPNLTDFANRGVRYTNSHSTFPTETRVNQSAVITGCYPAGHGIVANKFIDKDASPGKVFNTGDEDELKAAFEHLNGELFHRPTLSQRLAGIGKSFATLSTGTPGGARLINHDAEHSGNFRLSLHRPDAATPYGVIEHIIKTIGPMPKYQLPALEWVSYGVDCYLDYIEKQIAPDAMVLWLSEPDESFHHIGIGAPGSLSAIAHVDQEFGRILERQREQINSGRLQIIALSDHGQISLKGEPLDLVAKFKAGGFSIDAAPNESSQGVAIIDNAGGIWLARPDTDLLGKLVDWLQHQDWCGPIFTREGIAGTLRHRDVGIAHVRAPDISLVCRHEDSDNTWARRGQSWHDAGYPVGGGCHGGLSSYELHNFLGLAGGCFGEGLMMDLPAGNIDICPTIMKLFGQNICDGVDGRILAEGLKNPGNLNNQEPVEHTFISGNSSGAVTHLNVTRMGSTHYLDRAWVE
jgi:phosphonoacetate hydrolase